MVRPDPEAEADPHAAGRVLRDRQRFLHVADSWPLPSAGADEVRLYLKSGELTAEAPQAASAAEYDYDPANPVMTRGGEALLTTMDEIGARIQPEPGWRDDVITFESEPLDHDLHIQGAISVDLYVSSSAPDTAFTAKLMCVDPDGTARNYRTSITTIGLDTPDAAPYKPGEIRRVSIDMWGICWMVPPGRASAAISRLPISRNTPYTPTTLDCGANRPARRWPTRPFTWAAPRRPPSCCRCVAEIRFR